jgi:hypothetical protein
LKFTTFVPIRRNDGSPIAQKELNRIIQRLNRLFGGVTVEGKVQGLWIDAAEGRTYQDECLKISVACDNQLLALAEREVRRIGRQLDQKAMYMEVQYLDGVRILEIE